MNTFIVWLLRFVYPYRTYGNYWYRTYYGKSNYWKRYRRRKIAQKGAKCEKCKKYNITLDVHHLTYKRLFHERLSDTQVLCRSCHKKEEAKKGNRK